MPWGHGGQRMTINRKDLGAGVAFILIGAFFAYNTSDLDMGTMTRMGPGMFPLILSGLLALIGMVIIVQGIGHAATPANPVPWRGLFLVLLAPVIFGLTARGLGFVPAIALVALVTAYASRRMHALLAVSLAAGLTLFCVAVFYYGLGLPLILFGRWLPF